MRRYPLQSDRKKEQGLIITLVAVFMASVVIVMAALAIDLTTLYTARSEAQLAADSGALAAARVLANSGITSSANLIPPFDTSAAETLATTVALQVVSSNQIGGRNPVPPGGAVKACNGGTTEISVCFNDTSLDFMSNPHVTVQVTRTDLPTFFLRFWKQQLTVTASATAEAYNPSGLSTRRNPDPPVAPVCVKPWLLPNLDPTQTTANPNWTAIFDRRHGTIKNAQLIGQSWPNTNPVGGSNPNPNQDGLYSQAYNAPPVPGRYYAGQIDTADFNAPTQGLPACSDKLSTQYQLAVAGCVPNPIPCGRNANIGIAQTPNSDIDTIAAAECLIHYNGVVGDTDSIAGEPIPPLPATGTVTPPFQFVAGKKNPVASAQGQNVLLSDSIVTIPVYDTGVNSGTQVLNAPPASVNVIGFLQVFLNPQSAGMPYAGANSSNEIPVTIINQIGCGIDATGNPVYGNGPSAVPVRLITPP